MLGHAMLMAAGATGGTSAAPQNWRYVRLYITANNGNYYTTVQEIEIAASVGGADLTAPGMPVGQSIGNFAGVIDNAFDRTVATQMWQNANEFPMWGYVDLGAQQTLAEFRMQGLNYAETQNSRSPKDFKIQGSNDASIWTDIKSFVGVTGWVAATWKKFNLIDGTWS